MNDHELDQLLRSVPLPEWDDPYWKAFPESVARQVRAKERQDKSLKRRWSRPFLNWALGFAFPVAAIVVMLLVLSEKRSTSLIDGQLHSLNACYRQVAELFPGQLEAVILSADGAQLQLSDTPDVPNSPPLFFRICPPSAKCVTAVSFSGQKIRISGREFEVLANGEGEIFLLAKEGVWTPGQTSVGGEDWWFEIGWLERSL